jgi:hypothetical protein
MNLKYRGLLRGALAAHVIGGTISQLGSSAAIGLEEALPQASKRLAQVSALAELILHAPTALVMAPIVYGDKGVTPFVYGVTGVLLALSSASALIESNSRDDPADGAADDSLPASGTIRPELRRMCATISIFLYVRLYALMRGPQGFLEPQKYTASVVLAGFTMMPVGWAPSNYPALFWLMMFWNHKTVRLTSDLVKMFGIDGAATRMAQMSEAHLF